MEDAAIIDLFFDRSEQALTELIQKYGRGVNRVLGNILADPLDVEECASDTYHITWNRIPPVRPAHLGAYVCRIARNLGLSRYERNTAQKRNGGYMLALSELEESVPALGSVESAYDAKELTRYLNNFLRRQPAGDRVLFLRGTGMGTPSSWKRKRIPWCRSSSGNKADKRKQTPFRPARPGRGFFSSLPLTAVSEIE